MLNGCFTALITPFAGGSVDDEGLRRLVAYQIDNGITGLLAVGTTGESPTLTWEEHIRVIDLVAGLTRGHCACIAGTGSNNTAETLEGTRHAAAAGADAVLLVDPYYNGPSSLEIRREYVAPVAEAFPDIQIVPYVIPGRTGAQLLPEDLALLARRFPNVTTVKEATADLDNMRRTRTCCGPDFTILSGDDAMTHAMMSDPDIAAAGVISVVSNVVPQAVVQMVQRLAQGDTAGATALRDALDPIFRLVTVKTAEQTPWGEVTCRARNPLGIKTLMAVLGMPCGPCRRPLGRMTAAGLETVLAAARRVQRRNPEIFAPLEAFFKVDVAARLDDPANWQGLTYDEY